jgi:hypothetical protein
MEKSNIIIAMPGFIDLHQRFRNFWHSTRRVETINGNRNLDAGSVSVSRLFVIYP